MKDNAPDVEKRYQDFIKDVVATDKVWGLTHQDTWATSSSYEFEDVEVILFWSQEKSAEACAEDDWSSYKAESISLVEFLENWCVGMYGDNLLLGANWTSNLVGTEKEPLEVALDVLEELKEKGKTLEFTQYDSQEEFEEQVNEALEGEGEE
ncbi:DUF2750 domain-containing protein [Pontibacter sp. SGAir0037]|uniref:DUF2750 domain-containing protein n=1 Tax=Pontibacter sp. SGAir0037 TaxID=2571030 RepID=UPI0010CCDFD2|nr:DUF2750 domain-containing protein [Pontibacter sp. SGAir0037]QCR21735.1 DUF2750 domain-containing protein [Pontibacter sp. SGAir0037]